MKKCYLLPVLLFLFAAPLSGQVVYVNAEATGANDGSSWENAYTDLQMALDAAQEGSQIWVTAGNYRPASPDGPDTASFVLKKNVALYGGFLGTETFVDARDPFTFTTLSGDLQDDDIYFDLDSNRSDNVQTVLFIPDSITNETLIDRFVIEGGQADGENTAFEYSRGGGIFMYGAPTINNCVFTQNYAGADGGAIYYLGAEGPGGRLINCLFEYNQSGRAGGAIQVAYTLDEGLHIESCQFIDNTTLDNGGALRIFNANCTVTESEFTDNASQEEGGAIQVRTRFNGTVVRIEDSAFERNDSHRGGAIRYETGTGLGTNENQLYITNCTFDDNQALLEAEEGGNREGGALSLVTFRGSNAETMIIDNCVFSQNRSDNIGSAIHSRIDGALTNLQINDCQFTGNEVGESGTVYVNGVRMGTGTIELDSCFFQANSAAFRGGGLVGGGAESCQLQFLVSNSSFESNSADSSGGAIVPYSLEESQVEYRVANTSFLQNTSEARGGSVFAFAEKGGLEVHFDRCVFELNQSVSGAAIKAQPADAGNVFLDGSLIILSNCLLTGNTSEDAVIHCDAFPGLRLTNSTLADNGADGILLVDGSGVVLQNTILSNPGHQNYTTSGSGTGIIFTTLGGNIVSDLSLANLLGPLDKENQSLDFVGSGSHPFQLAEGSPAIDAGIAPGTVFEFDLAGNPRLQGNAIDAGAYESPFVTAGNDQVLMVDQLSVFPNPAQSTVQVTLENDWRGPLDMQIFNEQGQCVVMQALEKIALKAHWTIELPELPAGVYQVMLRGQDQVAFTSFVKK